MRKLASLAAMVVGVGACAASSAGGGAGAAGSGGGGAGGSSGTGGQAAGGGGRTSDGGGGGAAGVGGQVPSTGGASGSTGGGVSDSGSGGAPVSTDAAGGAPPTGGGGSGPEAGMAIRDAGRQDGGGSVRPGDAGPQTASDGGGDPLGSGCGAKPYKLCEDFESADVGGLPPGWMQFELYTQGKAGTVNVQADQFHGGAKALKSSSSAIDQPRVRRSLTALGTLANNHWGRIFYKVQTPAPRPNTYFHVTFAALTKQPAAPESRVVDTVQDPMGRLQYLYNLPDDTCCTMTGFSGAYDANWHCAEWYVSQTTNSYRYFQDGREIAISFTGNTNARIANISHVALGTSFYQLPPSPFVAWIDDLAINDTQIGCDVF